MLFDQVVFEHLEIEIQTYAYRFPFLIGSIKFDYTKAELIM